MSSPGKNLRSGAAVREGSTESPKSHRMEWRQKSRTPAPRAAYYKEGSEMPEITAPGPVHEERCIREAVCIHTKKIFDSCKDKDCIEDLRVYPTRASQEVIDRALSVKAGSAELLCAYIDVQPVSFNRGFFTVDVRYYYRITADAFVGAARPVEVCGLAVFDKRAILFGSEASAKVFTSQAGCESCMCSCGSNLPTAVVETTRTK